MYQKLVGASGTTSYTVFVDLDTTRGMEFVAEKIAAKIGTGLEFNPTTGEIQTTLSGTTFKGTVDLTAENTNLQGDTNNPDVNASPIVGDLYANIGGDSDGNGIFSTNTWGTITINATEAVTVVYPGDFIVWDGTHWNHLTTGTSNIGTDLSNTPSQDEVVVHSSTGADTTILEATTQAVLV